MKKILAVAMLSVLSFNSYSQDIKVEITKKVEIFKLSTLKFWIEQYAKNGDTIYGVVFNNMEYSTIIDIGSFYLNKKELKRFADALTELTDDKYKAGEATIRFNDEVIINKMKLGSTRYTIWINNSKYTHLGNGQVRRLKAAIYEFFGYE